MQFALLLMGPITAAVAALALNSFFRLKTTLQKCGFEECFTEAEIKLEFKENENVSHLPIPTYKYSFLKMGQSQPLFVYFCPFHITQFKYN